MVFQVLTLETTVRNGTHVADKEFSVLIELLMVQLLKLDTIEANGEAKVQRRNEVSAHCCLAGGNNYLNFFLSWIMFHLFFYCKLELSLYFCI